MSSQVYDLDHFDKLENTYTSKYTSSQFEGLVFFLAIPWDTIGTLGPRYFRFYVDYMNSHNISHDPSLQGFVIALAVTHPVVTLVSVGGIAVISVFGCAYYYFEEKYKTLLKTERTRTTHDLIRTALVPEQKSGQDTEFELVRYQSPSNNIKQFLAFDADKQNAILERVLEKQKNTFSRLENIVFKKINVNKSTTDDEKGNHDTNTSTKVVFTPSFKLKNISDSSFRFSFIASVVFWCAWITMGPITGVLSVGVFGLPTFLGMGVPFAVGLGYCALRIKHFFDHRSEDSLPNLDEKALIDQLIIACSEENMSLLATTSANTTLVPEKYIALRVLSTFALTFASFHLATQYIFWYASDFFTTVLASQLLTSTTAVASLAGLSFFFPLVVLAPFFASRKYLDLQKGHTQIEGIDDSQLTQEEVMEKLEERLNYFEKVAGTQRQEIENPSKLHKAIQVVGNLFLHNLTTFIGYCMSAAFLARLYVFPSTSPFIIFNMATTITGLTFGASVAIIGIAAVAYAGYKMFILEGKFDREATVRKKIAVLEEDIKTAEKYIKTTQKPQPTPAPTPEVASSFTEKYLPGFITSYLSTGKRKSPQKNDAALLAFGDHEAKVTKWCCK